MSYCSYCGRALQLTDVHCDACGKRGDIQVTEYNKVVNAYLDARDDLTSLEVNNDFLKYISDNITVSTKHSKSKGRKCKGRKR